MITLFEPFRSKIKLHIRQDFLQELWDKYVPVSAESYDKISLIYLKGAPGEEEKGTKQVHVLVDLVLKNLFMQINISQNPMMITQKGISKSLQYTLKHYLAQLRRTDLQAFQSLNRYMISLKQAETENTRFESWKKDSRVLGQMEKEYQILRHVSQSLRELETERSFEIEKMLGTELLRSMKKTEYRIFAKTMAWQERKLVEEYIRNCSQAEFLQMVERLAKETTFSFLKISEHDVSKERLIKEIENHFGQDDFWKFYHKVVFPEKHMSIEEEQFSEKNMRGEEDAQTLENVMRGEKDIQISENVMHREELVQFRKDLLIWAKTRKRMIHRLDQLSSEEIHDFWKQICEQAAVLFEQRKAELPGVQTEQEKETQELQDIYSSFCVKLAEVQKKYVLEMRKSLQTIMEETQEVLPDIFIHIVNQQPILKHSTTMAAMETAQTVINEQYELSEIQDFQNVVIQIRQAVEHRLEEQKNRIVEQEIEVLNRYQDVLHINDMIRDWDSQQQEEEIEFYMTGKAEKEFLLKYRELQLSEKEIQKLWSWSNALFLDQKYGLENHIAHESRKDIEMFIENTARVSEKSSFINEEVQELIRHIRQMDQEQYFIFVKVLADMIQIRQQAVQEQIEEVFRSYNETQLTSKAVRQLQSWSEALQRTVTIEDQTEYQKVVDQINEYGKQHSFHIEYRESFLTNETIQELLRYTRQMDQEQYPLLIRALSDMIRARQLVQEQVIHTQQLVQEEKVMQNLQLLQEQQIMQNQQFIEEQQLVQEQQIVQTQQQVGQQGVQMQQRTVQQVVYGQTEKEAVEKEFYVHHDTKISKEAVSRLYDWSKALLTPDTKVTIEERTEFQKIVEQINEYGRQHSFHLEYRESILAKETVQELLRHTRQMDREQYLMLVKALADMIQAQQTVRERIEKYSMQTAREQIEKYLTQTAQGRIEKKSMQTVKQESLVKIQSLYPDEERESTAAPALAPEELRYLDVEKVFRSYYGTQMTVEAIRELHDWSEALQTGEGVEDQEKNGLISERNQESLNHMSTDMRTEVISGDMQTEVIRQHIQQAKDRAELQLLVEQVNHYADGTVRLEYREEQIQNPSIQKLIRHIRQLDEEEHRSFIRQLSKMIEVRQGIQEWEDAAPQKPEYSEENAVHGLRKTQADRREESESRTIEERYQKTKSEGDEKKQTGRSLRLNYRISQRVYEIYPELSRRIQEYEVRRRETYETEIRQLTVSESMNHVLSRALRCNAVVAYDTELEKRNISASYLVNLREDSTVTTTFVNPGEDNKTDVKQEPYLLPEPHSYENQQDLKHAVSKNQIQRGQQEQDSRMQEEKIQIKSAQAQMDVRLKQVEQQLKQVKIQDNGKEDVRETAERIKKLLHEELHLEKLRRGMT